MKLTFANDPSQKELIAKQIKAHQDADEIVKWCDWQRGQGSIIGCVLHSCNHSEFETRFNIPKWFAHLIDRLFSGMSDKDSKLFPLQLWEAIPINIDLRGVRCKFFLFLLEENKRTVENSKIQDDLKSDILELIGDLHCVFKTMLNNKIALSDAMSRSTTLASKSGSISDDTAYYASTFILAASILSISDATVNAIHSYLYASGERYNSYLRLETYCRYGQKLISLLREEA